MNRSGHYAGVLALLTGAPLTVYDSDAPTVDGQIVHGQYAILFDLGADDLDDHRFTAPQTAESTATHRHLVRAVGVTRHAASEVHDLAASRLINRTPVVAGRRCDPIAAAEIGPVKRDTSTSPPLYFIESEYTVTSHRA